MHCNIKLSCYVITVNMIINGILSIMVMNLSPHYITVSNLILQYYTSTRTCSLIGQMGYRLEQLSSAI